MTSTFPSYPDGYTIPTFLDFVLQSVVDEYEARSVPLPSRQYWTIGLPAFDCDQLTVYATTLSLGLPGAPLLSTTCSSPLTLAFNIVLLRCTPVASTRSPVPESSSIQATAAEVAADMEILMELTRRLDPESTGVSATVSASDAAGGLMGCLAAYSMAPYIYS